MKNLIFILILSSPFASILSLYSSKPEPTTIPICHSVPTHEMASLGTDLSFINLHASPLPYHYDGKGEMITFATADGKTASGLLIKSAKKSKKWLFVYQEWWGLNDHIKRQAETFYNDLGDVNVLALDMYDGKSADKPEDAGKLMQGTTPERLEAIIKGGIDYAGKKAKIASVGWCFGGMLSLKSAILEGKQAVGCVMYYGRPEKDVEKLKTLNVDVLGIFGSQDKGIPPTAVAEFEENMKKANKKVTINMYDAVHGFANPSNPKYDKTAADDAYAKSLAYLKSKY
jgi:carboxymethylenebutenolidase